MLELLNLKQTGMISEHRDLFKSQLEIDEVIKNIPLIYS